MPHDYNAPAQPSSLPLTGTALEIHRRLSAGQTVAHITEVGRYKRSWLRADVLAVERWRWLQESEREREAAIPEPCRDTCGTNAGWNTHQRHREPKCAPCVAARQAYLSEWKKKGQAS